MNRLKRLLSVVCLVSFLGLLSLSGCSPASEGWSHKPGKKVMASFPPIHCFVQNVAGDDANLLCLMTTMSPHDYEVGIKDALAVRQADLFFCNGLELDEQSVKTLVTKASRKSDIIVMLADAVPHEDLIHIEHEEHPKGKHDHHHGDHDPHVWLSPAMAAHMVDRIAESLSKIDPSKKDDFAKRAAAYKKELKELHEYGLTTLGKAKNNKVITQHDSLGYFAKAFSLDVVGEIRSQSGQDNAANEWAKLIEAAKKNQVAALTHEVQYNKSEAERLLKDLKGQGLSVNLVEFDTLETVDSPASLTPGFYVQTMKKNIDNLAKALQ